MAANAKDGKVGIAYPSCAAQLILFEQ